MQGIETPGEMMKVGAASLVEIRGGETVRLQVVVKGSTPLLRDVDASGSPVLEGDVEGLGEGENLMSSATLDIKGLAEI